METHGGGFYTAHGYGAYLTVTFPCMGPTEHEREPGDGDACEIVNISL
jgi:hypothetical protein